MSVLKLRYKQQNVKDDQQKSVSNRKHLSRQSSRGPGLAKRNTWRAEITYANVRLRKRGDSKRELAKWLKKAAGLIKTRSLALPEDAADEDYKLMMAAVRQELSEMPSA